MDDLPVSRLPSNTWYYLHDDEIDIISEKIKIFLYNQRKINVFWGKRK